MPRALRNLGLAILAAVALALSVAGAAFAAAPGSLDPSFGGGLVSTGPSMQLFGVAVQPDGEVVAAGQSAGAVLVQRFTAAGQRDGTYTGGAGVARAAARQQNGQIVVAGSSGGMFAERFNLNGSVDPSFGSNGIAAVPGLGGSAIANAVAVAPDGRIVVAGTIGGSDTRISVARFNANGTLDPSFGSGGAEELNLGLPYEAAVGVAVQPDGKIVLAGREQGSPNFGFFNGLVLRLDSSGALDDSFASSGVLSYHHANSGYDTLNAVTIQNDGKIVVAGSDVGGSYAVFLRLNPTGSYDTSFGSAGEADLSSGASSQPVGANGVVIAGGGRVVGAGAILHFGTDYRAGLWALSPAGAADLSFGAGGIVEQPSELEACGMAIQPDGNLVVVGNTVSPTDPSRQPCSVASGSFTPAGIVARYVGFGPPPVAIGAPSATTGTASAITATSATLSGQVDPGGAQTSYRFVYGTTTAYGSSSPVTSAGAGTTAAAVATPIGSLVPGTTYHYTIVASNADGSATGSDGTFTTASAPPLVGSQSTTRVGELSAGLVGRIDPRGLTSSYYFDYGPTRAYGFRTRSSTVHVQAGASSVPVTALVKHLRPGTRYHYRLVASNSAGTAMGADSSFRTAPLLRTKLGAVFGAHTFSSVIAHGISFMIGCNQGCSVKVSLLLSSRIARQRRVITRQVSLGAGSGQVRRAGTVVVKVRLSKRASRELRHRRMKLVLTLRIVTTPAVSGHSHTVTRRVTPMR